MEGEHVLNPVTGEVFQLRANDPVIPNATTPGDFSAQYPTPLDTTEVIAMCEEVTVLQTIPEVDTSLKQETWREIAYNQFVTGSNLIAFADGYCPETYTHTGSNSTIDLKNIGVYKALTLSDIKHSAAVAAANWNGINRLLSPIAGGEGLPGADNAGTFMSEHVANLKEKEIRLGMTLLLNGEDRLLVLGDATTRPLEFDGIEKWFVNKCSAHTNDNSASGSFSAASFDRFISESCAKPTHVFGHPSAIQEVLSSYYQLGFAGSQVINYSDGARIIPGFNFAGFVNTASGRLPVVADMNFTRTNIGGGNFQSNIYALRMVHDGDPMIYRPTQFRLSLTDLNPGCTSIAFQIWKKTALVIKFCCAQSVYTSQFSGRITSSCPRLG